MEILDVLTHISVRTDNSLMTEIQRERKSTFLCVCSGYESLHTPFASFENGTEANPFNMISGRIHFIVDEQLAQGPKNMPEKAYQNIRMTIEANHRYFQGS